ncbi:hypothetical protein K1719_046412 [Acacia pycnantha]|nr:hypothetical protein K1719_046412 [Acacia pycnantha]
MWLQEQTNQCSIYTIIAELITIIQELQVCRRHKNHRKILLLTDSIEAIFLILRGCKNDHSFYDIVEDARGWFTKDWQIVIQHNFRENLVMTDRIAKLLFTYVQSFSIFDQLRTSYPP